MGLSWPFKRRAGRKSTAAHGLSTKSTAHPGGFVALHMQAQASWTRGSYTGLSTEGFMRNPVVHRCIRLVSEAAASVPWIVTEGEKEMDSHPLLELLSRPNKQCGGSSFFETLYGYLLISGNAYLEHIGASEELCELHLLRPDRVTVITDDNGWPEALEHGDGKKKRRVSLSDSADALHVKLFHPLDDHYGFPPMQAALMALDTHNAAGRWNKALLDNSARPSGALVYAPKDGGNLTDEQFDRLKQELENNYAGNSNAGRPMVLEGGLDWKSMGMTPKDMDFIEARNAASRDIALAFGVPPMLLGIPGDNTYANYQEANRAFYRLTVLPMVARVAGDLGSWLGPKFGSDLSISYDTDQVLALSAERDSLWTRVGGANFLTEDEKRRAVGYGPSEDEVAP